MAETQSIFDMPLNEVEEARLDALARAEIAAGGGVPRERVREWLLTLKAGDRVPPPIG